MKDSTLYLFIDETFPLGTAAWPLRMGVLACSKARFRALSGQFFHHFARQRKSRIGLLLRFITECPAFAVVAESTPIGVQAEVGSRQSFPDIGGLSATNEVWANTLGVTVACVLSCLPVEAWVSSRVEILVEDKSLNAAHWAAACSVMKRVLEREVGCDIGGEVTVGIERVQKRKGYATTDWRHQGVMLAHWVAKLPDFAVQSEPGTYARLDVSAEVSRIMRVARDMDEGWVL